MNNPVAAELRTYASMWNRVRILAEQGAGFAVLLGLAYWWLGLPVGSVWQLVFSALVALMILAGLSGLSVRAYGQFRGLPSLPAKPLIALAEIILLAAHAWLAYVLIWWVPPIESFPLQVASAAARFSIAYLLVLTRWLALVAVISAGRPRSSQEISLA